MSKKILLFSLFITVLCALPRVSHAADINLKILSTGKVINQTAAGNQSIGELYHGWRQDVLFAPLNTLAATVSDPFTVSVSSDFAKLDTINPRIYAVHGATSTLVTNTPTERTWMVSGAPGSQITLVAEVPSYLLDSGLSKIISSLSRIPDWAWFLGAFLAPFLTYLYFISNRKSIFQKRSSASSTIDPQLLKASPAALTVLLRGFVSKRAASATLIDLARRGHIHILLRSDSILLYRKNGTDTLKPHESLVLERWLGSTAGEGLKKLQREIPTDTLSKQGKAINDEVYKETIGYGWFATPPLFTHWKILVTGLVTTFMCFAAFLLVYITLPSATPLLWFLTGLLVANGMSYVYAPTVVHRSQSGKLALQKLVAARQAMEKFDHNKRFFGYQNDQWESYLPLAIVLGITPQWIKRWSDSPFKQPEWFLTPDPLRNFDDFLQAISPLLLVTAETIRETVLPTYT